MLVVGASVCLCVCWMVCVCVEGDGGAIFVLCFFVGMVFIDLYVRATCVRTPHAAY